MPIQVQWFDDQKTIILWTIEGQWALNDLHDAYTVGNALCASEPTHTINALIDMTRTKAIPQSIFSALSARVNTETPNYDMAVIVTNNMLIHSFVTIINTLPALRGKFEVVKSLDSALAFIEKRRQARATSADAPRT